MKKRGQDGPEIACTLNTAVPQPIDTKTKTKLRGF